MQYVSNYFSMTKPLSLNKAISLLHQAIKKTHRELLEADDLINAYQSFKLTLQEDINCIKETLETDLVQQENLEKVFHQLIEEKKTLGTLQS